MRHHHRCLLVLVVVAGFVGAACQRHSIGHTAEHPADVEEIGAGLSRVTLTERAVERIALRTDQIREEQVARSETPRRVVPYSALIYDPQGNTWVYTSPEARTFVRHQVTVDYIDGDLAVLSDGPPAGTVVASVGVAELYGAEFEVGH